MVKKAGKGRKQSMEAMNVGKYTMASAVRLTNVESHRLRMYEKFNLIEPSRTEASQRLYSDADVENIKDIAALEKEGVNLKGIEIILSMRRGERK